MRYQAYLTIAIICMVLLSREIVRQEDYSMSTGHLVAMYLTDVGLIFKIGYSSVYVFRQLDKNGLLVMKISTPPQSLLADTDSGSVEMEEKEEAHGDESVLEVDDEEEHAPVAAATDAEVGHVYGHQISGSITLDSQLSLPKVAGVSGVLPPPPTLTSFYRSNSTSRTSQISVKQKELLNDLLEDNKGFELLMNHLLAEYSMECLLSIIEFVCFLSILLIIEIIFLVSLL